MPTLRSMYEAEAFRSLEGYDFLIGIRSCVIILVLPTQQYLNKNLVALNAFLF